jgi:hypothetical protein
MKKLALASLLLMGLSFITEVESIFFSTPYVSIGTYPGYYGYGYPYYGGYYGYRPYGFYGYRGGWGWPGWRQGWRY